MYVHSPQYKIHYSAKCNNFQNKLMYKTTFMYVITCILDMYIRGIQNRVYNTIPNLKNRLLFTMDSTSDT